MKLFQASIILAFLCILLTPLRSYADEPLKIAFVRNHQLWVKIENQERQLTHGNNNVEVPIFSHDGRWIAYKKGKGLWAYDLQENKEFRLYHGEASNYQWSPKGNILAFQVMNDIDIINLNKVKKDFVNVSLGVGNYSWTPDGKGFIASSIANLEPTGWTSVRLYNIQLNSKMDTSKAKPFYTLPKESNDFFAIGTSAFKWSSDGQWLAFLAYPTASWSADSNTLCVIRNNGKDFMTVDKMLFHRKWFDWAPTRNLLAHIEGEGRFAVENKHLKVKELPAISPNTFTPKGYVDWDFTWQNNDLITVSRAKEKEWSNNPKQRPLPTLYQVNIKNNHQEHITKPPANFGDFYPVFTNHAKKLVWIRSNRTTADIMVSEPDGSKQRLWIKNVDVSVPYYEKWDWENVMDVY